MSKKNITLDDLALMVGKGFDEVKLEVREVKKDVRDLIDGQEHIKLRLDNVAYRFELVELQRRVAHLEKKAGVNYR